MTTWFVTRHEGAINWAKSQGIINESDGVRTVSEIQAGDVSLGDVVIGTLPIHLVGAICARGARYLHIAMTVPVGKRGTELTAEEMAAYGATCQDFYVLGSAGTPIAGRDVAPVPPGQGVQVCLVSDQYMANLLPILKRRPAAIELVCTPEVLKEGKGLDALARSLQYFGYDAHRISPHRIASGCSTDFRLARQAARTLRDQMVQKHPNAPLTLNVTGGTKILSTAFFLEFLGVETIYTDSGYGNCIRFLDDTERSPEPLGRQINTISDYFFCKGFTITDSAERRVGIQDCALAREPMTQHLAGKCGHADLIFLNTCAQKAVTEILGKDGGRSLSAELKQAKMDAGLDMFLIPRPKDGSLVKMLCQGGILNELAGDKFVFSNYDALRYLSGGWIEEWAWHTARECQPDHCDFNVCIQSLAKAAPQVPDRGQTDNELDLVVLHNNRLLIAECKTIYWKGESAKQEIFNKLDALGTHASGLFGKSLLISSKALDDKAARRARAYGIEVLQAEKLSELKCAIERWMAPRQD